MVLNSWTLNGPTVQNQQKSQVLFHKQQDFFRRTLFVGDIFALKLGIRKPFLTRWCPIKVDPYQALLLWNIVIYDTHFRSVQLLDNVENFDVYKLSPKRKWIFDLCFVASSYKGYLKWLPGKMYPRMYTCINNWEIFFLSKGHSK